MGPVLLTRPARENAAVRRKLEAAGVECLVWPLTRIVTRDTPVAVPEGTPALVFTSGNAVDAFAACSGLRDISVLTVGDRTAERARAAGFADTESAGGDLHSLARLIASRGFARVFHPRGREVAGDLGALVAAEVTGQIVYSAEPGDAPPDDVAQALVTDSLSALTIWSRRAADLFAGWLAAMPGWRLRSTALVAISARAAEPLAAVPFAEVVHAAQPDAGEMVRAVIAALRQ